MDYIIKDGLFFDGESIKKRDVYVKKGYIHKIGDCSALDAKIIDAYGLIVTPGFVDLHTHLREPGYENKETILGGTAAAAQGGYTTVCAMPNLNPCPDCYDNLMFQMNIVRERAIINVIPVGAITKGQKGLELAEIEEMANSCACFSDDGKGVQSNKLMERAMNRIKAVGKFISAHCEDESLLKGGWVHEGYAEKHDMVGISSRSEWEQVRRDLEFAGKTGCHYHVCHISCRESIDLVRKAKQRGVAVTCEVTPHHISLCEDDILCDDGKYKMNPPLRSADDRKAIWQGIKDGTIDCIATDHAPHTAEEKSRGLEKSAFGIVGLETAFAVCYTTLVKSGMITLEKLLRLMSINPAKILGQSAGKIGQPADLVILDTCKQFTVDSGTFAGKGRSTPFDGVSLFGEIKLTMCGGEIVFSK